MRGLNIKRKTAAIAAAGVLTVATAGGAYAYWSTTGSGSGSATAASSNGTVVLHAAYANGLTPGASETVTYTADNLGSSSLRVGTITPTVSIDDAHVAAGCDVADFTIAATTSGTTVAAGASDVALGTGTLTFKDTDVSQDGCKGATVTLTLASS
jgi:hypothetical protein